MADSPRTMEAHHLSSSSVAEREFLGQLASLGSDVRRYARLVLFLCIAPVLGLSTARIDTSLCAIPVAVNVYDDQSGQCAT